MPAPRTKLKDDLNLIYNPNSRREFFDLLFIL